ncbi:MAG: hypothetical protein A3K16_01450 [Omnitrophica bacterium RIFCSPLOWO2_01_FULL_45_24]|nr:MAG: hypothetical protein A3K16_01450 [Omnitrophica bacterium RIFCSPLOWO2_01_FULL_45_24]
MQAPDRPTPSERNILPILESPKVTVTVDNTAPSVLITSPLNDYISNTETITVSGTIDDNQAAVTVNGIAATVIPAEAGIHNFTASGIPLNVGQNTIAVTAADLAGNSSSAPITVTYQPDNSDDTTPPSINIYTPDKDSTTRSNIIYGGVSDDAVRVTVNGTPATVIPAEAGIQVGFIARPALVEGQNTVTVKAWDAAGNLGQSQISFAYNTATPKVTITLPIDNATINISPIKVEGIASSDIEWVIVKNGSAPVVEGKFVAESIQLFSGLTVITAEGHDKDDKLYEDSIIINSPELSDYQIVSLTESVGEFEEGQPVAGSTILLKITLYKNNQPAPNEEIQFKVTEGNGALSRTRVYTDANGEAQIELTTDTSTANGNKVECLVSANPLVKTSFYFYTKPSVPSTLTKVSDDSINLIPEATIDLIVKLTDTNNNPIPNETINFQITQGNGTLSSPTAVTTNYGEARTTLTTPNPNETTQITASSASNPTLTATFNIATSQAVNLTFDEVMAKVNENGNKVQDFSADVVKLSDEPGAAPEERYKLWKKGAKSKIQLTYPEQRSYLMERTQNSINLDGKPFLTTEGSSQGTGAAVSKIVESASGDTYVLQVSIKTPKSQELTRTYVDYSKGVTTRVSSEVSNEFTKSSFEKEYSHILVSGIWLPEKITTKTTNFIDNTVHTKTETFSNITVNSGIPDSFFQ